MRFHGLALALLAIPLIAIAFVMPPAIAAFNVVTALIVLPFALLAMSAPSLRGRWVLRFDEIQRHFRLLRLVWERGEVGFGKGGYSAKLALALEKRWFQFERGNTHHMLMTLLGLRISYARSYGGIFAR